jgi:epoxyqueuosine reductase
MIDNRLETEIRRLAEASGIDVLGFAEALPFTGYALPRSRRRDPALSLPGAKTIVVVGIYIGGVVLSGWTNQQFGRTSRLFLSGFFLDVVKPLAPLVKRLKKEGYQALACSDGSILPLKLAAVRAGLGWQGKHTMLVSKKYGTFLALGGIITDAELKPNAIEEPNLCRMCGKCVKACPLGALDRPFILNRGRCLSSVLQKEQVTEEVQEVMENRVLDCEICQYACPWNLRHLKEPLITPLTKRFRQAIPYWERVFSLTNLAGMTAAEYRKTLGCLRAGIPFSIFHRNVHLALTKMEGSYFFSEQGEEDR